MLSELLTIRVGFVKKASRTGPAYFTCAVFLLTLCNEEYEKQPSDSAQLTQWYNDFKRFILTPVDKFLNSVSDSNVPELDEVNSLQESIDNYTNRWNPNKSTDREKQVSKSIKPDKAKKLNEFKRKLDKLTDRPINIRVVYYRPRADTPRVLEVIHTPRVKVEKNTSLNSFLFTLKREYKTLGISVYSSEDGFLNDHTTFEKRVEKLPLGYQIAHPCQLHLLGDRRFLVELGTQKGSKVIRNIYESENRNATFIVKNGNGSLEVLPSDISEMISKGSYTWRIVNSSKGKFVNDIFKIWDVELFSMGIEDDIAKVKPLEKHEIEVPPSANGLYLSPVHCSSSTTVVEEPIPYRNHGNPQGRPSKETFDVSFPEVMGPTQDRFYNSPGNCNSSTTVVEQPIPTPPFPQHIPAPAPALSSTVNSVPQSEISNAKPKFTGFNPTEQYTLPIPSYPQTTFKSDSGPRLSHHLSQQSRISPRSDVNSDSVRRDTTRQDEFLYPHIPIPQSLKSSSSPAPVMYLSSQPVKPEKSFSNMVNAQPNLATHDAGVQNPLPSATPTISFPLPISKPEPGPSTLKRPSPQPKELTTKHDSSGKSPVPNLATTPTPPIPQSGSNPAPAQCDRVQQISDSVNISTTSRNTAAQPSKSTSGKPVPEARISAKPPPPISSPAPQSKPEKVKKSWFRRIVDVFTGES